MKTINLDEYTHKELKSLCKKGKRSMVEFVRQGVVYFKKTGIDPSESVNESPQKAIRELAHRVEQIIGIIKTQEQERMNPLLEQLMMLIRRGEILFGDAPKESTFKSVLHKTEEMIEADQNHHLEQLNTQHKYYEDHMNTLEKNYQQRSLATLKKLDEVVAQLDKMTAALKTR